MALQWDPTLDDRLDARRRTGRPKSRWIDSIKEHVQKHAIAVNQLDDCDSTGNDSIQQGRCKRGTNNQLTTLLSLAKNKQQWMALERTYAMGQ